MSTNAPPDISQRMGLLEGRIVGALDGFGNRLDGMAEFIRKLQANVDALNAGAGERDTTLLRVDQVEKLIDNLPARVGDLEKYGSEHTIQHEPRIEALESKVKRLQKRPKKKRQADQQRWNKMLAWAAIGGCGYMLANTVLVGLGVLISYLLLHH